MDELDVLIVKSFLVEHVLAKASSHTFQVGDMIRQFLDGFNLFSEEVRLQPVCELEIGKDTQSIKKKVQAYSSRGVVNGTFFKP